MPRITVGGSGRLHSGGKISQEIQEFNRSNHNLSKKIRATVAPGVITPIYRKRVKPGDTFDIEDIEIALYTDPTERAMYGSYTAYIEFFYSPTRLKQAWLHNNKEYIGEDMSSVKLPIFDAKFNGIRWDITEQPDIQQINPSSLLSYMGFRSAGQHQNGYSKDTPDVRVIKNAEKIIDYYDIVKNYYSNRQEKEFWIIDYTRGVTSKKVNLYGVDVRGPQEFHTKIEPPTPSSDGNPPRDFVPTIVGLVDHWSMTLEVKGEDLYLTNGLKMIVSYIPLGSDKEIDIELEGNAKFDKEDNKTTRVWIELSKRDKNLFKNTIKRYTGINIKETANSIGAKLMKIPITNCDDMREDILSKVKETTAFTINAETYAPYGQLFKTMTKKAYTKLNPNTEIEIPCTASYYPMQGLAICTYKSDRNNNWLDSEYVDKVFGAGGQGVVDVTNGLNLNTLLLAQKIFNQANKIAIGNRSYNDWLLTIHGQTVNRPCEIPVYEGGMSQEIYFEEIRSTAATEGQPVGTIAANGVMGREKNGGKVVIRAEEAGLIYGILRIVPNVIYSQGNDPDDDILTMDDIHQPDLDGIGYQDLVTEYMAAIDTRRDDDGIPYYRSVGKQPAWINYMTDVDEAFGDFAIENNKMPMTLNRRYQFDEQGNLKDGTTYIDPSKFNYMWAGVARNDMHFDVSIGMKITARRKLSTRQMPNF